jgi:hypothetical protein
VYVVLARCPMQLLDRDVEVWVRPSRLLRAAGGMRVPVSVGYSRIEMRTLSLDTPILAPVAHIPRWPLQSLARGAC